MTDMTNPYNLPEHYLHESSTTALARLKANDYADETYNARHDALLIMTHWREDCTKETFFKLFYINAFNHMAVKAYGTHQNALPDEYVNIILTALKKNPLPELADTLRDLEYMSTRLEREKKVQAPDYDIRRERYMKLIKEHKPK